MPGAVANDQSFDVAIVGGGIIGLVLATGLIKRNLNVKVYEQARGFREIGAGVAFTANTMRCMNLLDPQIVEGLKRASTSNKDPNNPQNALQWVDGYNHDSANPNSTSEKLLFKLVPEAFQGCHRAHLLNELVKLIPEAVVEFNKRLDTCIDRGDDEKLLLNFHDGTTTEADAVIGCDGVKSRVRELILGEDNPASYPHFSHKVAFCSLIPMDQAEAAVGAYKARNWHMHLGPGVHILHFPVANQTLMNFVAFVTDPRDWPSSEIMTAPATKAEVVEAFADWGPAVRAITNLLPDELDKWAMFDTYDYPAPTYTCGRVCIAGDAAHASTPHLGAGAGVGIEDALALATVLEKVTSTLQSSSTDVASAKAKALRAAFNAYDAVRRERSQDFVHLSRNICDTFEWANPETGSDTEKCFQEIKARFHKIWYFDIQGMLRDVADEYERQLTTARGWTESKI